jgi:protocatechuate 3,4-dioxygenase beta subunit
MQNRSRLFFSMSAFSLCAFGQTAAVEGVVTNGRTGVPLPRANVTLCDLDPKSTTQYGALTTADGKFSVIGMKPGSYAVTAARVGFVMPRGSFSRVKVTVTADDKLSDVRVRLTPVGAIMGRVVDADGTPVERAEVIAEGAGMRHDSSTDDQGQFRIGGLAPGRYRVKASHDAIMYRSFMERSEIRTDGTTEVHTATTYYPGVLRADQARRVEVRPDGESPGIDIQLLRVPFVRVSGKARGMPREPRMAFVTVPLGGNGQGIPLEPDGSFEIWGLDPGKYRLGASWEGGVATAEVEVASTNIENVELRVVPPSDIAGRLESETPESAQPVPGRKVILSEFPAPVGEDGTFNLEKVPAGKYVVSLSWESQYVKSMRLGSQTIDGRLLDLSNSSGGAELTLRLSAATGSVSGTVLDDQGKAVEARVALILDSENPGFATRYAKAKPDGSYAFQNLPPGRYKLVAVPEDDADLILQEPGLAEYEDAMDKVEVGEGEKISRDLAVVSILR